MLSNSRFLLLYFNAPATTEIYTLSLHDALPICFCLPWSSVANSPFGKIIGCICFSPLPIQRQSQISTKSPYRSEEHTSELQSQFHLVCRLLLEKKKPTAIHTTTPIRVTGVLSV